MKKETDNTDTAKWHQAPSFGWRRDSAKGLTYVTFRGADVSTVLSHSSAVFVPGSGSVI